MKLEDLVFDNSKSLGKGSYGTV